jgi:pyruvate kinase
MLGKLLDAGMNVLRLNFSHGDHPGHFEVLQRYRKVGRPRLCDRLARQAAFLGSKVPFS